jgi:phenylacetate-CoA ligase
MFTFKRKLYESLSGWLAEPICWIPFRYLAGSAYRLTLERGPAMDRASRAEVLAFQEAALGRILRYASEQVPAYQSLRATVERLSPFEALKAFPLVAKAQIQGDMGRYLPRDLAKLGHYECTTGGTSGNQLKVLLDDDSQSIEMGFMHRLWARIGYDPRLAKATFRGVEVPVSRRRRYWKRNPIYNEWQFSLYHINESTLPIYIRRLQKLRPPFLHGYPSAISLLARYVLNHGIPAASFGIRGVLLGSEALLLHQREQIQRAFAARPFSWYGHSERVILAGECEHTCAYHHFPDYGFLEMVDDRGETVRHDGDYGELVGTGFWNESMPLIRYRTEDRARKLDFHCDCGRCFDRFDDVEGRWKQEYVIGKSGSWISLAALNMHGREFERMLRYQYRQRQRGILELHLMVLPEFGPNDEKALLDAFHRKLGDELTVVVKIADNIPLTSRGKIHRLIQELPLTEVV